MGTFKRRLLRGLVLLPIVLCLAGWGWSGWYWGRVSYARSHRGIGLGTGDGAVYLGGMWNPRASDGFSAGAYRSAPVRFWSDPYAGDICFLGFRWRHWSYSFPGGGVATAYLLIIPYWFPLLVSALLCLLVWRKTRPRPDPATAFPVEVRGERAAPGGRG